MERFEYVPEVALAVYAHPDDADVAAGATIAAWASRGAQVHLVVVCDGAKGSHDPTAKAEGLRERRSAELEHAAELLGAASVTSLGRADGSFDNDEPLRSELVGIVRALRPEIVLGPDPTATFFAGVYINHRDHRETGWALLDSVAPASAMPLYFPERGVAHAVSDLLLSGTQEPDVVVDVSTAMEAKVAAVLAHSSQLSDDHDSVRRLIEERAQLAGREIGARYGEAFRHVALGL